MIQKTLKLTPQYDIGRALNVNFTRFQCYGNQNFGATFFDAIKWRISPAPKKCKNAKKENDENFEQLQQHALNQFQQILNTNEKHTDEKKYSSVENDDRPKKRKRFTKRRGQGRS